MAKVTLSLWNVGIVALIALAATQVAPSLPVVGNMVS